MKTHLPYILIALTVVGVCSWAVIASLEHAESQSQKYYEFNLKPDIERCRDLGKYPVVSGWNGRLIECKDF